MDFTIYAVETKALKSCAPDLCLCHRICKNKFSHDAAQISVNSCCHVVFKSLEQLII